MHDALRTLLEGIVDYAGLFPPAGLAMAPAVRGYARYRAGAMGWMLGRFVAPVARLEELEAAAGDVLPPPTNDEAEPWRLSALLGADADEDVRRVLAFNARHAAGADGGRAVIDAVEVRAAAVGDVARIADAVRRARVDAYVEVPVADDPAPYADAAAAHGVRLKIRTGGVTPDAFPHPAAVLRFLVRCAERGVPCKATAGLHHPLRGVHPLTYEPDCARGAMFGFLNVFLAATFLHAGAPPDVVAPLLEEDDPHALAFDDAGVTWRGHRASTHDIARTRARGLVAFGSCSFEEPVRDLQALGLLKD